MLTKFYAGKYRLVSALYLFFVYAFGVFSKSAWSDDFPTLLDPGSHELHAARDGRIVYGWLIDFLFSHFTTIQSLSFVKLFGLVGLLLLNDLLIRKLLSIRFSVNLVIASSLAFTLPSFQFSAHWAVLFMLSWTAYIAVLGYDFFSKQNLFNKTLGIFLFSISILIYPLMSFFIFPYIYILWFTRKTNLKNLLSKSLVGIILILCSSILSYAFSLWYIRINDLTFNPRVSLVSIDEVPNKIVFFITRPFILAYRPYFIDSPSIFSTILTAVFFVVLLLILFWWRFKSMKIAIINFLILNVFFVLALLPLLAVSQNQIDMRFVSSNTWLYVFVASSVFLEIVNSSKTAAWKPRWLIQFIVPMLLLSVGAFTINTHYLTLFYHPFNTKQGFFHDQLSKCSISQIQHGVYIVERTIPWPQLPYIGAYSQSSDLESSWVPVGAVTQYLRDINMPPKNSPVLGLKNEDGLGCEIKLDEYPNY